MKSFRIVISFAFCLTVLSTGLKTEALKTDHQILADMEAVLDRHCVWKICGHLIERLTKTESWRREFQKFENIQNVKKNAKLKHHTIETIKLRRPVTPKARIETKFDYKTYNRRVNKIFNLIFG